MSKIAVLHYVFLCCAALAGIYLLDDKDEE